MNWDDYLKAKDRLGIDDDAPPTLVMSGVAGDNATRYLLDQKGTEIPNDQSMFQRKGIDGRDFIWDGENVHVHLGISSSGHPALAGFSTIDCAGIVEQGYFFFHSGHYHPKQVHALHFFSAFVNNTCAGMAGTTRDNKIDELCNIRLKLYQDQSEIKTYTITFADLAETRPATTTTSTRTAPMTIGQPMPSQPYVPRSSPMLMSRVSTSTSSSYSTPQLTSSEFSDSPGSLFEKTGINAHGRHQLQVRIEGAPTWIDDSSRIKCALCMKSFGTFTRKHHCRRCGEIVCADCSTHTKIVRHPAIKPKATEPEKQPVRVCDLCFNKQDLI